MVKDMLSVLAVCGLIYLFFRIKKKRLKIGVEKASRRDQIIRHVETIMLDEVEERCQTVSPKNGLYCCRPATYYYAGLALCSRCAQNFITEGANPAPFPIPTR